MSNVTTLKEFLEASIGEHRGNYHKLAPILRRELRAVFNNWLHEAMTRRIDELFSSTINGESFQKLSSADEALLKPFVQKRNIDKTKRFFTTKITTSSK